MQNYQQNHHQTDGIVYHLDQENQFIGKDGNNHISRLLMMPLFRSFLSLLSDYNKHFVAETGGDASITNSNSNFGQLSLNSDGFKKESFDKDDKAFITSYHSTKSN